MTDELIAPPLDPAGAAAAAARFAVAAAAEADVAYAHADSPIGRLLLATTARGVVRISFMGDDDVVLDDLARRVSPRILEAPARLDATRRELEEYFAGTRTRFDLPLDWSLVSDFARRILGATAEVPFGRTATYGEMAAAAGGAR